MTLTVALDTETTGRDFRHGSKPFLVTFCSEEGNAWYEWDVDPLTRQPTISPVHLREIIGLLSRPDTTLVLHNSRFDCMALDTILTPPQENQEGVYGGLSSSSTAYGGFPWDWVEDTLVATHVLGSALKHDLTNVALQYLRYRKMKDFEDRTEVAVRKARDFCRRFLKTWKIAKHGIPDMPSCGKKKAGNDEDKLWKNDMWLLRAIIRHKKSLAPDQQRMVEQWEDDWAGVDGDGLVADYANLDSDATHKLWPVLKAELHRRDLWEIYKERMRLTEIAYRMERNGLTLSEDRLVQLVKRYDKGRRDAKEVCLRIAKELGYPLTMPKGSANNNSLKAFVFGEATVSCPACGKRVTVDRSKITTMRKDGQCIKCKRQIEAVVREWRWLNMPVVKRTETDLPSLDKETIEQYLKGEELSENQREFLAALTSIRRASKAIDALMDYQSFWFPYKTGQGFGYGSWRLIHPNLNPQGTDTLRFSCRCPNLQNISKQEDYNLREAFGPAPGREAWSLDFRNIEKRIPVYESGEQQLIDLFERADEPPFFGSDHLLKFSVIYPDIWQMELTEQMRNPEHIKKKYKATYYQWIKNTNFALQYECGDAKADSTAHAKGVKKRLSGSFPKEAAMKRYWISYANKYGYVETMPRRSVNPRRGYPLMCKRTEKGTILSTVPLAYHVSGTAMDLTAAAMIVCQQQLDVWNGECGILDHYRMSLQVHDELFFDFPKAEDPRVNPRCSNLSRIRILQRLMEDCGKDLICRRLDGVEVTIPTPVSCDYHPVSWAEGFAV